MLTVKKVSLKVLSVAIAFLLVLQIVPPIKAEAATKWTATPYHSEDGTYLPELAVATEGKLNWASTTENMPASASIEDGKLIMSNGSILREFSIPEVGGTEFYTKSYQNLYTELELMDEEPLPDVYLALYDKSYDQIYNDRTILLDPEYYFVGGADNTRRSLSLGFSQPSEAEALDVSAYDDTTQTLGSSGVVAAAPFAATNNFIFDGYIISEECEVPFDWQPHEKYGDPAAEDWPPKGVHVEFDFSAPDTFPLAYQGLKIKVIYEMYDNLAAMKKRVEITNENASIVTIGRLAPEVLNGNANMDDLMYIETSFTGGHDGTIPFHNGLNCECKNEKTTSPFLGLKDNFHTCYDVGPAYTLPDNLGGNTFKSFETYELVYSNYWFEHQSRERLGMYRKLFPWITDNPLTFHNTGALTKATIDMISEAGFEMIIQSYGSSAVGDTGSMLSRDQAKLDKYKDLVDYAHSKGVDIGIYQAQYQLGTYNRDNSYGKNGIGQWGTWCVASAAFDDYWDNFKYFVEYTGMDCVEIDGTYPNCFCNNGENHLNQDREYDPNPANSDTSVGNPSKYAYHNGYHDSKVKQWENAVRMMSAEFRNLGVYVKVPAWYYVSGGNKCGIGYEEAAWSQPREEQLIYSRQLIHNASYVRTMSMSWTHVPFQPYQGGGSSAAFQPFKNNKADYNWVLAQTLGNGLTSDFRGNTIYDDETLHIMQKWVSMFKKYRGIVNSDMVHINQANYGWGDSSADRKRTIEMDALYHANANNPGEKGLLWVYNQTDIPQTKTFTVPMYYTGLTDLDYAPVPVPGSMGRDVKTYGIYPPNYKWLPEVKDDYAWPAPTGESAGAATFSKEGIAAQTLGIDSNGNAMLSVTLPPMSFTYYSIYNPSEAPQMDILVGQIKGLAQTSISENTVSLSWNSDVPIKIMENNIELPNTGQLPDFYKVYRNNEWIGDAFTNNFADETLEEQKIYQYQISAVFSGVEGTKSKVLTVATQIDEEKPIVTRADMATPIEILVDFNESVDEASATNVGNYSLSDGSKIYKAELQTSSQVLLTVSSLDWAKTYSLTVSNVTDSSAAKNKMDPTTLVVGMGTLRYFNADAIDGNILVETQSVNNGTVKFVESKTTPFVRGLGFNGRTSYGELGSDILKERSQYSVSLWVNPESLADQVILSQGKELQISNDFTIQLKNGSLEFVTNNGDGTANVHLVSPDTIGINEWNLVVVTREEDRFALYLNGELADEITTTDMGTLDSVDTMLIGAQTNLAGGEQILHYKGMLDEIKFVSYPQTEETIKTEYYRTAEVFRPLVNLANSFDSSHYTPESFSSMKSWVGKLEALMATTRYSYVNDVYTAVVGLRGAIAGLEKTAEIRDLVASYTLNEKDGSVVIDQASGKNGTLTNGNYTRTGTPFEKGVQIGSAIKDYLTLPNPEISGDYTLETWVKPWAKNTTGFNPSLYNDEYALAGTQPILATEDGSVELVLENGFLTLNLDGTGGSVQVTASAEIAYDTFAYSGGSEKRQAWNHVAVSRSGDDFTLYLNGISVGTLTQADVGEIVTPILVGTNSAKQRFFQGIVDEIKVFSVASTAPELSARTAAIPFDKVSETNLAKGKTVTIDKSGVSDLQNLSDGRIFHMAGPDTPFTARVTGNSPVTMTINLGGNYQIDALSFTYFSRAAGSVADTDSKVFRRYTQTVIQVADNAAFTENVTTVYNNDAANTLGYGAGSDPTHYSTDLGYDILLKTPVQGRYARIISGKYANFDGTIEDYTNINELEVFGKDLTGVTAELSDLVAKANLIDQLVYTTESTAQLQTAIDEAEALLLGTPTLEDCFGASRKLETAMKNLVLVDNKKPELIDVYPKGDKVALSSEQITLLYNKNVAKISGKEIAVVLDGNRYVANEASIVISDSRVDIPFSAFMHNGEALVLTANKTYSLEIEAGAFESEAGTPTDITTANFTTGGAMSVAVNILAQTGGTITTGTSGSYKTNEAVNIAAKANDGYEFVGWILSGSGKVLEPQKEVTTFFAGTKAATITAQFKKIDSVTVDYQITVSAQTGGYIQVNPTGRYTENAQLSLKAVAEDGYEFAGWTVIGGGTIDSMTTETTSFVVGSADASIVATFRAKTVENKYALTVSAQSGGKIIDNPTGKHLSGAVVNLKAIPDLGYEFAGWTVIGGGTIASMTAETTSFVVGSADASIVATFRAKTVENKYALTVSAQSGGKIIDNPTGKHLSGAVVSLKAIPDLGYKFSGWVVSGAGIIGNASGASTIFVIGTGDVTVTAGFKKIDTSVTITTPDRTTSGGGGGGGGSSRPDAANSASQTAKAGSPLNLAEATKLLKQKLAAEKSGTNIVLTLTGNSSVKKSDLIALRQTAEKEGKTLSLQLDQKQGNTVTSRIYLSSKDFDGLPETISLDIALGGGEVARIKALFEKYFTGTITPVKVGENVVFGSKVRVALKLENEKLTAETLVIYHYDVSLNKYSKLNQTEYFVDSNGYAHVNLEKGGVLLITEGELTKRS